MDVAAIRAMRQNMESMLSQCTQSSTSVNADSVKRSKLPCICSFINNIRFIGVVQQEIGVINTLLKADLNKFCDMIEDFIMNQESAHTGTTSLPIVAAPPANPSGSALLERRRRRTSGLIVSPLAAPQKNAEMDYNVTPVQKTKLGNFAFPQQEAKVAEPDQDDSLVQYLAQIPTQQLDQLAGSMKKAKKSVPTEKGKLHTVQKLPTPQQNVQAPSLPYTSPVNVNTATTIATHLMQRQASEVAQAAKLEATRFEVKHLQQALQNVNSCHQVDATEDGITYSFVASQAPQRQHQQLQYAEPAEMDCENDDGVVLPQSAQKRTGQRVPDTECAAKRYRLTNQTAASSPASAHKSAKKNEQLAAGNKTYENVQTSEPPPTSEQRPTVPQPIRQSRAGTRPRNCPLDEERYAKQLAATNEDYYEELEDFDD